MRTFCGHGFTELLLARLDFELNDPDVASDGLYSQLYSCTLVNNLKPIIYL